MTSGHDSANRVYQPGRPGRVEQTGQAVGGPNAEDLVEWLRHETRRRISAQPSPPDGADRREWGLAIIAAALDDRARRALRAGRPPADPAAEQRAARRVWDDLFGLGGLQPLLDDPDIENINCNGADSVHIRRADGSREQAPAVASSDAELLDLIRTVVARSGAEERRLDRGSPAVSVELADGSRLFAVVDLARRPLVSIRRHRHRDVTLAKLERLGTVTLAVRELLSAAVRARLNIVISGGTSAGKTTLLRALSAEIPADERLVVIEDTYELGLDRDRGAHPDAVALQAREPNIEGKGGVALAELTRWALRMSPDRVIVGEVRGGEALPMLQAMSQGNDGSLSTIHASGSGAALLRLATYLLRAEHLSLAAANLMIAGAVHLVVHLDARPDGHRAITSVREVVGAHGDQVISNEIIQPGSDGRGVPGAPPRTDTAMKLVAAGLNTDVPRGAGR